MTDPFSVEDATGLAAEIQSISMEFDEQTIHRHRKGGEKYGPAKFLTVDTIEEALNEVVDLANYARYTYIRLRLIQKAVMDWAEREGADERSEGFIKGSDTTKPRKDA